MTRLANHQMRSDPGRTNLKRVVIPACLLGVLLAIVLIWGGRQKERVILPVHMVDLDQPILTTAEELDDALYIYVVFLAIGHDGWLASEASMVSTSIELTGLGSHEDDESLLNSLPGIKKRIDATPYPIRVLDSPSPAVMETGIVLDPREGRVRLLQGRMYTQDGHGGIIRYLHGAAGCAFTIELRFSPGDYGDPGDLDSYWVKLAGQSHDQSIEVRSAGGRIADAQKVRALLDAARLYGTVSQAGSYKFDSDDEAERVKSLARRVALDVSGIEIDRTDDGYVARDNLHDVALLLCFERHGNAVLEMTR